jgi:hypothetical protein
MVNVGCTTTSWNVVDAVNEPDVPVIVTVAPPTVAVLAAVSARVEGPAVFPGDRDAVTPAGRPLTAKLTSPENPNCGLTATKVVVDEPGEIETLDGVEIVNAGAWTCNCSVVVRVTFPSVPVMVRVDVAGAALLAAVRVRTLEPDVGLGVMLAVTPAGRPEMERFTLPLEAGNPLT